MSFQNWGCCDFCCKFSWLFHAFVFVSSFCICCYLFVIMFNCSGTPAGPGKKSCQMPFFSTSCWFAIQMTTAQRYTSTFLVEFGAEPLPVLWELNSCLCLLVEVICTLAWSFSFWVDAQCCCLFTCYWLLRPLLWQWTWARPQKMWFSTSYSSANYW